MWHKHSNIHWFVFLLFAGLLAAVLADQIRVDFNVSFGQKPAPDFRGGRVGEAEDRILVKFRPSAGAAGRAEVLGRHGLREIAEIKPIGVRIVSIPDTHTPQEVVDRLVARERELAEGRRRTPIIALTANAMAHHEAEYTAAGMDVLVPKPLELERLIGAIQTVMEGAA